MKYLLVLSSLFLLGCVSSGEWVESEAFYFQGTRTMGHAQYHGAAVTEALEVLDNIEKDNPEDWYEKWNDMAVYQSEIAEKSSCNRSKGNALLRASNYFRTAEFFLPTDDSRRLLSYEKSRESFVKALSLLEIDHRIWDIPFQETSMRAYYFPGDSDKPVIMFSNGIDGTVEECFFFNGYAAIERGYPVILYEGPGQSMLIRKDGITTVKEWDIPVKKIIDTAEEKAPELKDSKKILYGVSMGGHMSGHAARALEDVDGLVIHGAPMDFQQAVLSGLPDMARDMYYKGKKERLDSLVKFLYNRKILSFQDRWAYRQLLWVLGKDSMSEVLDHLEPFTLKNFEREIPVLILNGEEDLYEGVKDGGKEYFPNAEVHTFPTGSGAASHCQSGAVEQSGLVFFNWMNNNF